MLGKKSHDCFMMYHMWSSWCANSPEMSAARWSLQPFKTNGGGFSLTSWFAPLSHYGLHHVWVSSPTYEDALLHCTLTSALLVPSVALLHFFSHKNHSRWLTGPCLQRRRLGAMIPMFCFNRRMLTFPIIFSYCGLPHFLSKVSLDIIWAAFAIEG